MAHRPIDSIEIGERHRRDLGEIDGLAESIKQVGLLHPIVIRNDGRKTQIVENKAPMVPATR